MAVLLSGGNVVSTSGPWSTPFEWTGSGGNSAHPLFTLFQQCGYDRMYRCQPSVRKVVDKLAGLHGTVPLGAFRRGTDGVTSGAPFSPLGLLMADPCPSRMDAMEFWDRFRHFYYLHGTSFAAKVRDPLGRPSELLVIHPSRMRYGAEQGQCWKVTDRSLLTEHELESGCGWWYQIEQGVEFQIARRDLVIWKNFNPDSEEWGLSKLESLRATLDDDASARAAMTSMWRRGARPAFVVKATDDFSNHPAVIQQIKDDIEATSGGVTSWQRPLILDGGLDVEEIRIEKDLEYLELRKLTDREVGSTFDITPPALHDLERATFNNVEELLRDVMRTTMQPHLRSFESVIEHDLRDGRHGLDTEPDFGSAFYVDHNESAVLRGSPEALAETRSTLIQTGQRTLNEIRAEDNLPPVEGGDTPLVNAALVPLANFTADLDENPTELARMAQQLYLATPEKAVLTTDEARSILNRRGAGLGPAGVDLAPPAALAADSGRRGAEAASVVLGRLSRVQSPADIDPGHLVSGLAAEPAETIRSAVAVSVADGSSVAELRALIRKLEL